MSAGALPEGWMSWSAGQLEAAVRRHNRLYWDEHAPEIEDTEFDRLVERLRAVAPTSSVLDALGPDPALRVGAAVTHRAPMLSLEKCYDEKTLRAWADKFDGPVLMMPKIDGLACSIRYGADGRLEVAATRGDGAAGEDVTANVSRIANVPKRVPAGSGVEVRGEVYLPLSRFKTLGGDLANPRNAAAGALKLKDPERSAAVGLRFLAYDLLGAGCVTEAEKFDLAKRWGFETVEHAVLERDEMQGGYARYVERREGLEYEIDGVVFRANRVDEQVRLGVTAHHPRGAIAYKLQGESGVTVLEDVEWSVSRTRVFTPVGIVRPVVLSGATVSRISLHNWGLVQAKGLTLGARVTAVRRGGVIPYLEGVVEPGEGAIRPPTHCPVGGFALREDGDQIVCTCVSGCASARVGELRHFVDAAGIEGFGDVWLQKLVDDGRLTGSADFYRLTPSELTGFDRMGDVLAAKLVEQVQSKRVLPLAVFLTALGVPGLGKTVAQVVAQHARTLAAARALSAADLCALPRFAEVSAEKIVSGLAARASTIDALLGVGVIVEDDPGAPAQPLSGGALSGQSFLFTGTLAQMRREDAQARVEALGGKAASGVSKALTYLVVGSEGKAGSKLDKARAAGVTVLTEPEFITLLEGAEAP